MFWVLLIGLYLLTLPINSFLLRLIWYQYYPPTIPRAEQEEASDGSIAKAQFIFIILFGLIQPAMAALPLMFSRRWYHWVLCAGASIAYSASGSPVSFVDCVRSSHIMFLVCLGSFFLVALIVVNVTP